MKLTKISIVVNQYSSDVSMNDTEGKGTNLKGSNKVQPGTSGNPNKMPVPWCKSEKDFNEHHIKVYTSDEKYTYYIWEDGNSIYYSKTGYDSKTVLHDSTGGSVNLIINSSGDLSMKALASTSDDVLKYLADYVVDVADYTGFISEIVAAGVEFAASSDGQGIISAIKSGITPTSFDGTDYVSQTLATKAFSGLNLFGSSASKNSDAKNNSDIGPTMTVGVSANASFGEGISSVIGCAVNPAASKPQVVGFASAAATEGVQAGAEVGVEFGFWAETPDKLEGMDYGVVASGALDAGVSVGVYFDSSFAIAGLTIGIDGGEEFEAAFAVGYTVVIS